MNVDSNVLALITNYQYEDFLEQCLRSICDQTRKPDFILVVDDCSDQIPTEIVRKFPSVTLLRTKENGGPYRIMQAIAEKSDCEVIMFQDADDWSAPSRLELLLLTAQESKAQMVGCQIENFSESNDSGEQVLLPLDPIQALLENPICHSVFLSSSIIDRAFVLDLGGFSTAWRFGADSEFIRRAVFGGIVKNISDRLYFRRIHPASLTHHHLTGFGSPERIRIQKIVQKSGLEIVTAVKSGRNPDLAPVAVGQTAELLYVCGPRPNWF